MDIEKDKIRKGFGYPLKSSLLEKALLEADITTNVHLIYGNSSRLFEAFYWLPNENVPFDRFYVRTGAFEVSKVSELRTELESSIIPEFIKWATELLALPSNSPRLQQKPHIYW